ncbi:unnamed protein product [Soboliphyme baturini]|uniref:PAS domain-containing protein n=1 Tax=Soboliphyme baturini TaxID=241478 RepID=A0A183J501_9BILA|nr:unnamed protein product [Soboliphyme baturini]
MHFCCIVSPKVVRDSVPEQVKGNIQFYNKFDAEWKFTCLDSSATDIIGYIPFEILGISGYDFYHPDDLRQIADDQEKLMANGEGLLRPYRFRTKADRWVLLQTNCYISTCGSHVVRSIECVNQVLSDVKDKEEQPRVSRKFISQTSYMNGYVAFSGFVAPEVTATSEPKTSNYPVTHVIHPQPGVSIEHSPLPAVNSRNPIDITNEEERMLCQQLMRRQTNLQHQIALYQEELRNLQNKLMMSIHEGGLDNGASTGVAHSLSSGPSVPFPIVHRPTVGEKTLTSLKSISWSDAPCGPPRSDPGTPLPHYSSI